MVSNSSVQHSALVSLYVVADAVVDSVMPASSRGELDEPPAAFDVSDDG